MSRSKQFHVTSNLGKLSILATNKTVNVVAVNLKLQAATLQSPASKQSFPMPATG